MVQRVTGALLAAGIPTEIQTDLFSDEAASDAIAVASLLAGEMAGLLRARRIAAHRFSRRALHMLLRLMREETMALPVALDRLASDDTLPVALDRLASDDTLAVALNRLASDDTLPVALDRLASDDTLPEDDRQGLANLAAILARMAGRPTVAQALQAYYFDLTEIGATPSTNRMPPPRIWPSGWRSPPASTLSARSRLRTIPTRWCCGAGAASCNSCGRCANCGAGRWRTSAGATRCRC